MIREVVSGKTDTMCSVLAAGIALRRRLVNCGKFIRLQNPIPLHVAD